MSKWTRMVASIIGSAAASICVASPSYTLLPNIHNQYLMATSATSGIAAQSKALQITKQTLGLNDSSPYRNVRIRTEYNSDNQLNALIVYLLNDNVKGADITRINLNNQQQVTSVIDHYRVTPDDLKQSPNYATKYTPHCPNPNVQFVIGNNFTYDQSVQKEVQKVYNAAKQAGYNPFLMTTNNPDGPQPTVHAYEDWMSCKNVKGFYNESHGGTEEILLSDGDFMYSTVDSDLQEQLKNKVVLFDSCSTFNDPLLSSMTKQGEGDSQQYIAGIIPLPFGASERTASCFWLAGINQHAELTQNLIETCADSVGLERDAFRIAGNGTDFLTPAA